MRSSVVVVTSPWTWTSTWTSTWTWTWTLSCASPAWCSGHRAHKRRYRSSADVVVPYILISREVHMIATWKVLWGFVNPRRLSGPRCGSGRRSCSLSSSWHHRGWSGRPAPRWTWLAHSEYLRVRGRNWNMSVRRSWRDWSPRTSSGSSASPWSSASFAAETSSGR
jgi:hypothetical protein